MRKFPVRVCPAPSEDADPVDPAAALDLRKSNRRSLNAPDLENPAAGAPSTAMTVAPSLNTSLRLVNVPGVRLNALTGAAFARIAEKSNRRSTNNPERECVASFFAGADDDAVSRRASRRRARDVAREGRRLRAEV